MNGTLTSRYAVRSLMRHRRRSFLSVVGIGVGCALCMCLVALIRGEGDMMKRAASDSGNGHLRICPADWLQTRDDRLRLGDWQALRDMAERAPGVERVAPHARSEVLLAMGTRTAGVIATGVDPTVEPGINRLVRGIQDGRYLDPEARNEVVIGRELAKRLDVEVGHELLVTASGVDGEIGSALWTIVGIVATGSKEMDSAVCHVRLAEIESLTGYDGAGELSIQLRDPDLMPVAQAAIADELAPDQRIIGWQVIVPQLAAAVRMDRVSMTVMITIVTLVVFLGIASAELAAVLERRKEFAVLSALGTSGARLILVLVLESVFLGVAGGLAALALGLPAVWYMASHGIDFSAMYGDADMAMANILMDPILYADAGWWLVGLAFGLAFTSTILSSLYPAWFAIRTDPANALRVEQ